MCFHTSGPAAFDLAFASDLLIAARATTATRGTVFAEDRPPAAIINSPYFGDG
jgi:hypothetical protein